MQRNDRCFGTIETLLSFVCIYIMLRFHSSVPSQVSISPKNFSNLQRQTFLIGGAVLGIFSNLQAEEPIKWNSLRPMLEERCYDCHGAVKTKGGVDLFKLDKNPSISTEYALWEKVKDVVANGEMPPRKEEPLKAEDKARLLNWVTGSLDALANSNAGDPGPVTMRRLTNAEYDYTLRDLTKRDYGLAKEFPADGGGAEGFSNTGDVLFVSPTQLDKYLAAARKVADRASVMPGTGIVFQEQRVGMRGATQFKAQAQQALYVWYQHKAEPHLPDDKVDMREADYLLACWKWKHHELTGAASLEQLAKEMQLSLPFLQNWWNFLTNDKPQSRFLDLTRLPWRELPAPDAATPKAVPPTVLAGVEAIGQQRKAWYTTPSREHSVQRMQQDADGLRSYDVQTRVEGQSVVHLCIGDDGDGNKGDLALVSKLQFNAGKGPILYFDWLKVRLKEDKEALEKLKSPPATPAVPDPKKVAPLTQEQLQKRIAETEALMARFGKHPTNGKVDPDGLALAAPQVLSLPLPPAARTFKVTFRLDLTAPDAEFATIQWRLATGTPPDVTKVIPGVLTQWKRQTETASKFMRDFGIMKGVFPDLYERRLEEVSRNYTRNGAGPGVYYFSDDQLASLLSPAEQNELRNMKVDWRYLAPASLNPAQGKEVDALILGHLHDFAARAWRRPLLVEEVTKLDALYAEGRTKELDRESAAREVVVFTLVSPHFLFKAETQPVLANEPAPASKASGDHPLSAWELASRLSYFLWSSLPDEPLRKVAADGSLLKPEVLAAQAKRMMQDPKAEAMAREFMGQWLAFDGFANHNGVDAKKYPEFTPELRRDLYRETVTFFDHLIREDRPIHDILTSDYTFLNERLARFYGIPGVQGEDFRQVNVAQYHRGGLLGMGSVLTKTSRPIRTSPVLRGNWLLQTVLGLTMPPPPPNVPELKANAQKPTTMREMLEQHRADAACSVCHDRIDPLGFALESFDPIGRFRTQDDEGLKIDDSAGLKDGTKFAGLDGLRNYLRTRDQQFNAHFSRKLLGYALGRQVLPTDKILIAKMQDALQASGGKPSAAVLTLVNSRQFLNRKVESPVASNP